MRISDWSSDVCSSDLDLRVVLADPGGEDDTINAAERCGERAEFADSPPDEKLDSLLGLPVRVCRQDTNVTGYASNTKQAGFPVEQVVELVRAHAQMRLKVKHDARIDRPETRSHHQSIEGREPHGRVDALPVRHRAQARAVSEMRRDHPPTGKRPVAGSQLPGDIFVGQSMKSIADRKSVV